MSKQNSPLVRKNLKQHQDFDKVIKKTFTRVYNTLIEKLIGIDLKNTVQIPTTFSKTKEKKADFAVKVLPKGQQPHIVHVEFQGKSDSKMHIRELGYYHDFYNEFGIEVIQYVIFLGASNHKMVDHIRHQNLNFAYTIIDLKSIDAKIFLESNNPHELILAILCHYDKTDAPIIIHQILEKLMKIAQNERELFEYTTDLEILSGLRKLQSETKKQIDKMPITYDLTKDLRFQDGLQRGKLEGKLEGELEGEIRKAFTAIVNMLKLGAFDVVQIADILEVELDFVKKVQTEWLKNPYVTVEQFLPK